MRRSIALLLLILPLGQTKGEEKFSYQATPGNLPNDVVPRNYTVHLEPDSDSLTTIGAEDVEVEVLKPTDRIILNALDTTISNASLSGNDLTQPLSAELDSARQTVTFQTREPLRTGRYRLSFRFQSRIQEQPKGLFLQHYQSNGQRRQLLATQFEPTDARRMFPCWDEPAFRATFQLTVKTARENSVVSNMPEAAEQLFGTDQKIVVFERTPSMASYHVALVCSNDLEWLDDEAEGVKLRIVTTRGKKDFGRYAIDITKRIFHFYSDYFGIPYPLPKLDQIAVPAGFDSAMEKWGAITYNEDGLLYDPKNSSETTKQRVFSAVAHQIARQWFGDLVTMARWDDSWLNEAFASWMQDKVADYFNPDWRVRLQAVEAKERAMQADERRALQPAQQPDASGGDGNELCVETSSIKGRSLLRMIESFLGPIPFRNGIRTYLAANKYSSATTANLWEALEQSSGKPVQKLARNWVEEPGFPLIKMTVQCVQGNRVISLEQSRFAVAETEVPAVQWYIPVAVVSTEHPTDPKYAVLEKLSDSFGFPGCDGALIGNAGGVGFFRVWYEPALLNDLQTNVNTLPESDVLTLVSDMWAMVESHRAPASSYLDLVEALRSNPSYYVWRGIITSLKLVDQLQQGQPGRETFQKYVCSLLEPQLAHLGWTEKADDDSQTKLMRSQLIGALGRFGDRTVIDEAFRRFEEFQKAPETLAPDLRPPVTQIVGRYSSETTYNQLYQLAKQSESMEEKRMYFRALQAALEPSLARRNLESAMKGDMTPPDAVEAFERVAVEAEHPDVAWDFAKRHLEELLTGPAFVRRNLLLPSIAMGFSDDQHADELVQLTREKLPPVAMPAAENAASLIRVRAHLKTNELPAIDACVQQQMEQGTHSAAEPQSNVIGEQ
ncbi:MAG: M1 family metallopeptidase [Chthoniobacterales bacterium]